MNTHLDILPTGTISRWLLVGAFALAAGCGSSAPGDNDDDGVDPGEDTAEGDVGVDLGNPDTELDIPDVPEEIARMEWICTTNVTATNPYGDQLPGDQFEATFEIPDGTFSFFLGAYEPGELTVLEELIMPDGSSQHFLFDRDYGIFHTAFQFSGGELDSLLIPPAPEYADMVQPGEYTLRGVSTYVDFCFYVLINEGPGVEIVPNFYFVDVPGLDAASAPTDPDWQQVVAEFDETFDAVGVSVNAEYAQYYDITGVEADQHSIIRSQDQVSELVALSFQQGDALDDALTMNIFLINGFGSEMRGVLGISPGIPGAAGVHGSPASGVIFATEGLLGEGNAFYSGNDLLGQTMAHEVGHFLGLFHTTELGGRSADPITDTPECPSGDISDYNRIVNCPDYSNLMFPTASFRNSVEVSAQQAEILRGNPLIRP